MITAGAGGRLVLAFLAFGLRRSPAGRRLNLYRREIAEREGVTYTNVNKHLARASQRAPALREGGETPGAGA